MIDACPLRRRVPSLGRLSPLLLLLTLGSGSSAATECAARRVQGASAVKQATVSGGIPHVDLSLRKSASATHVATGGSFMYVLEVENAGPETHAGSVLVTDVLPDGLTLQTAAGSGWTCAEPLPRQLECRSLEPIAAGQAAPPIRLFVAAGDEARELENIARVVAAGEDGDASNDEGSVVTSIFDAALPDLEISLQNLSGPVASGDIVQLAVQIANRGAAEALGPVSYRVDLPAGSEFVGGGSPTWHCGAAESRVTCVSEHGVGAGASLPSIGLSARVGGPPGDAAVEAQLETNDANPSNDRATLTITVGEPRPVASRDRYSTVRGQLLDVARPGVLGNDVGGPTAVLRAESVAGPFSGDLQLRADGSFSYAPAAGFVGTDTFYYRADNGSSESALAAVDIDVSAVGIGAAPVANDDRIIVVADRALEISSPGILANDADAEGDVLQATLSTPAGHGALELGSDGSLRYVPDAGFLGEDQFGYVASDGALASEEAEVTLVVRASGHGGSAPVAADDAFELEVDAMMRVPAPGLLANDSDPDGDLLTIRLTSAPQHGVVGIGNDGSLVYRPDSGFSGEDELRYVASDGELESQPAIASFSVAQPALQEQMFRDGFEQP